MTQQRMIAVETITIFIMNIFQTCEWRRFLGHHAGADGALVLVKSVVVLTRRILLHRIICDTLDVPKLSTQIHECHTRSCTTHANAVQVPPTLYPPTVHM